MRSSVDVHNYLVEREIPHELLTVRGRLRSAERIASVLDLPPAQVGKVVVFETDRGPLAAVVQSDRTPDGDLISKAVRGHRVEAAAPNQASHLSEYLHEAIPPVGLPATFSVVIDRPLAARDVLYFAGGEARAILKVRGKDLVRGAEAKVARITREPSGTGEARHPGATRP